jgi:PKHD-type hydroxylase
VKPVTRGSRWGSFFWTQSMVKDDGQRAFLYDMDMGIIELRRDLPDDHPGVLAMTAAYHNLLRRWVEI